MDLLIKSKAEELKNLIEIYKDDDRHFQDVINDAENLCDTILNK